MKNMTRVLRKIYWWGSNKTIKMTTAITENKPLCVIHQSNDRKLFVEMTVEELDRKMENSYMIINWQRISTARNLIRQYWPATPVEYYQYYILPSLPFEIKSKMQDLFARMPPEVMEKISLKTILEKQESVWI